VPKHTNFYAKEVPFFFWLLLFAFRDRERRAEGKKCLAHFGNGLFGVPQLKCVALQCTDLTKRNNAGGEKIEQFIKSICEMDERERMRRISVCCRIRAKPEQSHKSHSIKSQSKDQISPEQFSVVEAIGGVRQIE